MAKTISQKQIWEVSIDERLGEHSIGGTVPIVASNYEDAKKKAHKVALRWHYEGDEHEATFRDGWYEGDGPEMWKIDGVRRMDMTQNICGVEFALVPKKLLPNMVEAMEWAANELDMLSVSIHDEDTRSNVRLAKKFRKAVEEWKVFSV